MEGAVGLDKWLLRWLLLAAGVLGAGLLAGAFTALAMTHRAPALAILCFVVSLLPIIVRVAQRRFDPFEPIQIVAITFVMLYGIRPGAELIWNVNSFIGMYARGGFDGAALISAVGMLCVYIGYALTSGRGIARRLPSVPDRWDAQRSVRFGIWVLVACAVLTALFAATVGPSVLFHFYWGGRSSTQFATFLAVSGYVSLGPYLTIPAAIIFLFAFARLRTAKTFLLFAFSLGVALFLTLPRGDRTYVIAIALPLLVFPYLRKGRRPSGVATLVAVLAAVLALNVFLATREAGARQSPGKAIAGAVLHVPSQLKKFATGIDLAEFSVLELEHEAYYTATNPLKFHPGRTLLSAIAYPLPRKLIGPGPKRGAGQWVVDRLFPQTIQIRASFNPAIFGDFFSDAGWVTIILYDLVVGIAVRVLWEYFRRFERSEGVQIVFAATLPVLVIMVRNSVVDAFARSLFLSGPLLLCLVVGSRERMRKFAGYRLRPELKGPRIDAGYERR